MRLSNAFINDEQRVLAMTAAPSLGETSNVHSSSDQYLSAVTYFSLASVTKQRNRRAHLLTPNSTLSASLRGFGNISNNKNSGYDDHSRISPTMKYPCDTCGNYGRWKRNHLADGILPTAVKFSKNSQLHNDNKVSYQSSKTCAVFGSSSKSCAPSSNASSNTAFPSAWPLLIALQSHQCTLDSF